MASRFPLNGNSTSDSPIITGLSGDTSYIQIGMEVSFYTTSDSDGSTLFPGSVTVVSVNTSSIVVSEDAMTSESTLYMAFHSLLESSPTASGTLSADLSVSSPSIVSLDANLNTTASINADLVTFTKDFNLLEASLDANASVLADLVTTTKDFNLLFAVFTGNGDLTADLDPGSPPIVTLDSLLTAEASCSARTFVCIRYLEANLSGSANLVGGLYLDISNIPTVLVQLGAALDASADLVADIVVTSILSNTVTLSSVMTSEGVLIADLNTGTYTENALSVLFTANATTAADLEVTPSTVAPSISLEAGLAATGSIWASDLSVYNDSTSIVDLNASLSGTGSIWASDLSVYNDSISIVDLNASLSGAGSIWASDLSVIPSIASSVVPLNLALGASGVLSADLDGGVAVNVLLDAALTGSAVITADLKQSPTISIPLQASLAGTSVVTADLDGGVAVNVLLDAILTGSAVVTADLKQSSTISVPLQTSLVGISALTADLSVIAETISPINELEASLSGHASLSAELEVVAPALPSPVVTLESSLAADATCSASLSVVSNIISIVPMAASFAAAAVLTGALLIDNQLEAEFWGTGEMAPAMVDLQPRPEARLSASGVMSSPALNSLNTLQPAQFSAVGKITAQLDRGMEGIGVCHVVDDLFRMWGIEKPCATTLSVRERAITDLNAAMQTIWSFSKNVDFWTRTTELVTVPAGIGSILLSNDIQNVLSPCRTQEDNRPLAPLHSIDELENFSIYYLGGLTHAQATGTPTSFYVQRDNQTGNDPARCTLHLAPTPVVDTTVKLDVIKECPRFSWKDYENCSRIPIPHQYIESILLPITRYRSSNYRLFYDKEGKSAIFEEYQMALGQLGANDPIPTWDKTEQQGDKS